MGIPAAHRLSRHGCRQRAARLQGHQHPGRGGSQDARDVSAVARGHLPAAGCGVRSSSRWLLVALLCAAAPAFTADTVFTHPASAAELAKLTRPTALSLEKARAVRGKFVQ